MASLIFLSGAVGALVVVGAHTVTTKLIHRFRGFRNER